jgi:DNA (cytosine-5)-methyltransferase 1
MRCLELFSGAGGLAKGLELSGFEHEAFVELNGHACSTLAKNFNPRTIFQGNVKDFQFEKLTDITLVAGGPPCQPFSLGGKHRSHDDDRDMFPYAINAISTLEPKAFIFENVKGLLRSSFKDYFEYVILRLTFPHSQKLEFQTWEEHLDKLRFTKKNKYIGLKYEVQYQLLNAADYGVPQTRERVIIVGIRSDLNSEWSFPKPTHSRARLLWEQNVSGQYWDRYELSSPNNYSTNNIIQTDFFEPNLLPWQTTRDALNHLPDPSSDHEIADHIFRNGARIYPGHTGSYIDLPAKTIKAGDHGVPGGENMLRFENGKVRYFTIHEAKLIQTFAPEFIVSGGWGEGLRQIGNAVPVKLATILGLQIQHTLSPIRQDLAQAKNF